MNFIKKIFDGEIDGDVHLQFQKFSKGEFKDRAVIKASQSKGKFTILTTSEFANELVKIVAEKLGDMKTNVSGAIVSTLDMTNEIEFKEKKQFQGVKRYILDTEMFGKDILELIKKFPKAFFGLSFNVEKDGTILKIKPKSPKSGKPGKSGEKPKADFCRLVTYDEILGKSFVFEDSNFKKAEISHDFIIEKIIFPEGEKDYSKIRENAKRQGKIVRKAEIDGEEKITEKEFTA
tara:strand:- start:238 stop:939 length:702 start_codon:yes stop_codon:yes gene_type:complete